MSKSIKIKHSCTNIADFEIITHKSKQLNKNYYGNFDSLEKTKNDIENINQKDWNKIRKYTNIYECPGNYYSSFSKPISRAYYKLWEILYDFNISCNSESLHLCEAPGGFIEATLKYKKQMYNNSTKMCHTISLINPREKNIPKYHDLLCSDKFVNIITNLNGDLYNVNNIIFLYKKLKDNKINYITADGGLTENNDFNNKEILHTRLFLSEIFTALVILENKGTFVLKIFDISLDISVHIIYLLSYLFEEVYLTKPLTSRPSNSEKYLVCKNFIKYKISNDIKNKLFTILNNYNNNFVITKLFTTVNSLFIKEIQDYNNYFIQNQILCIQYNLRLIKNNLINTYKVQSDLLDKKKVFSKNWMIKYNLNN